MSGFVTTIYNRFISPYSYIILVVSMTILFLIAGYYAYTHFYNNKPEDLKRNDIANSGGKGETITFYMFHVDWCPHCKTALPEWKQVSDEYNDSALNGYHIEMNEVNCTDEDSPQVQAYIEKYGVDSFPTIKAIMRGDEGKDVVIAFDAKATKANLEKFVQAVSLGNNSNIQ
jgi:thiol-disulfide isomerase/thioredoxin